MVLKLLHLTIGWRRRTFRFSAGAAAGNLSEVGIGGYYENNLLFSRALIVDDLGSPTTINVLSDEFLDVTYELRLYPKITDTIITNISLGLSTHNVTIRPSQVTSGYPFGYNIGAIAKITSAYFYSQSIVSITGVPGGGIGSAGIYNFPYVQQSLKNSAQISAGLTSGNHVDGISTVVLETNLGNYQVGFSPPIMKTSDKVLKLDFEISWGRYVP